LIDESTFIDQKLLAQFRPNQYGVTGFRRQFDAARDNDNDSEPPDVDWHRFTDDDVLNMENNVPQWIVELIETKFRSG
jgi:hypothetical protein